MIHFVRAVKGGGVKEGRKKCLQVTSETWGVLRGKWQHTRAKMHQRRFVPGLWLDAKQASAAFVRSRTGCGCIRNDIDKQSDLMSSGDTIERQAEYR